MSEYVINSFDNDAYFDFASLDKDIPFIIDAMDQLIEENQNNHALKEQKDASIKWRNIGLGYMGTADMLAKLSMVYGSDESIEFLSKLTKHIFREALYASVSIAKVKGSFPGYSPKVWDSEFIHNAFTEKEINKLKETNCLRNSTLLSIAPTGSLSSMLNVSGGIEPWFAISYTRRTVSLNGKDTYYTVNVKTLDEWYKKFGSNKTPAEYFVTAADISYKQRIKLQGTVQKYIDTAISSTVNLPKETTQDQIEDLYLNAWSIGCKGVTIYVDGSRDAILSTDNTPKQQDPTRKAPKRPKILEADWYQVVARGQIFNVYIGIFEGKPYEIFAKPTFEKNPITSGHGKITKQQKGVYSWINDKEEGVISDSNIAIMEEDSPERVATLLASLGLRHGADIKYIVKTLKKTNPLISSFTAAMIRVLNKYNTDDSPVEDKCPECGATLTRSGGCIHCDSCGFSKCMALMSSNIFKYKILPNS